MVRNGEMLLVRRRNSHPPIKDMLHNKVREHGVSHGLAEVGYDIRLKQDIRFIGDTMPRLSILQHGQSVPDLYYGRFVIASAIEEFDMPNDLMGIVHDKSTWARKGLSVFNTVIEPGWKGFLTLELVYHGNDDLHIPAGSGIAQVIFHELATPASYEGKYQNQADQPVEAQFT